MKTMSRYQLHQWAKVRNVPRFGTLYIEGEAVVKMHDDPKEEGVVYVMHGYTPQRITDMSIVSAELIVEK